MKEDRHLATAVCSWRGHVLPAARVRTVHSPPWLGIDLPADGVGGEGEPVWRLARCLRCDAWVAIDVPSEAEAEADTVGPTDGLEVPPRHRELRSLVVLRVIAIERAIHSLFFAFVAIMAVLLRTELSGVQSWVRQVLQKFSKDSSGTGNLLGSNFIQKEGHHLLELKPSTLNLVIAVAAAYCILEGIEAVGLWRERRWAEYLTVVATCGFIPLEIYELLKGFSTLKLGALVLNVIVAIYLVWSKRLFGLGRFRRRGTDDESLQAEHLLAVPRHGLSAPTVAANTPVEPPTPTNPRRLGETGVEPVR